MFTGIIETIGTLKQIEKEKGQTHFLIESDISRELHPDQSVAHDGVCLTVTDNNTHSHRITAVQETLDKTNLSDWQEGRLINLERALKLGDRLDGHIVQGHVDSRGKCIKKETSEGNYLFRFEFPTDSAPLIIEKGSICINGVSLTAFGVERNSFSVTIIPYTLAHTSFQYLKEGEIVNLEYDILGKYFIRKMNLRDSDNL